MIARFAIPFFLLMALVVVPLAVALLCRYSLPRRWWRRVALMCTIAIWCLTGYGFLFGFQQLSVRHIEYVSPDLPEAFDGYRIVHFSDAHVASMTGSRQWMVQRAVDSINAQQADAIVFTGDMQNVYPDELPPQSAYFRQLRAKDGVFAVLGNHDYAVYQSCSDTEKAANCQKTVQHLRNMGFDLLLNEHRIVRRDSDSIVIAGMENWGTVKRMPRNGDVKKTLAGLSCPEGDGVARPFTVMLQHDPSCWREKILPECSAQLTLSGHTHGGQISLFGWSPVALNYSEWRGMTYEGSRAVYVSTGLGALIPFRLGLPGEIAVITLKRGKPNSKSSTDVLNRK
jgi:predicted MPP superfamily phosphohydrolase